MLPPDAPLNNWNLVGYPLNVKIGATHGASVGEDGAPIRHEISRYEDNTA